MKKEADLGNVAPSSDLLKKSENKKKPGGQPGHEGKTRKGFGRVDRHEVLRACKCHHGGQDLASASDDFSVYNSYKANGQQSRFAIRRCLATSAASRLRLAHLRRRAKKLIKTPGLNNQSIELALTSLIDEAFQQHRLWRETSNAIDYFDWAAKFKIKVQQTLSRWQNQAGYEAGRMGSTTRT